MATKKPRLSYVNERHDPESVVHVGVLFPRLPGQVAVVHVVVCDRAVSEHASEVMDDLGAVGGVIPAACLRQEGIRNQRAHQGSEPNEEVKSLQTCQQTHGSLDCCTKDCFCYISRSTLLHTHNE